MARAMRPAALLAVITLGLLGWRALLGRRAAALPSVVGVLGQLRDTVPRLGDDVWATTSAALLGLAIAVVVAVALATLLTASGPLQEPLLRVITAGFAAPVVAFAPILHITLPIGWDRPATAATLAFLPLLLATSSGLRSFDRDIELVVRAHGGSSGDVLVRVRAWMALPAFVAGLQVAVPSALLGAILVEYVGAERGLGVALLQAQSSFQIDRTWAIAVVIVVVALGLTGVAMALHRRLVPWMVEGRTDGLLRRRLVRLPPPWQVLLGVAVVVLAVVAWSVLHRFAGDKSYYLKGPGDVADHLLRGPSAGARRSQLLDDSLRTVEHAALGSVVGIVVGLALATLGALSRAMASAVRVVALLGSCVPILAFAPLVVLLFGRAVAGTTVLTALVVGVPTVLVLAQALQSTPRAADDVVRIFGGTAAQRVLLVGIPAAMASVWTALRVAAPAGVQGALLAEWLASGDGLGGGIFDAGSSSQFGALWTYSLAAILLSALLAAMASVPERASSRWLAG